MTCGQTHTLGSAPASRGASETGTPTCTESREAEAPLDAKDAELSVERDVADGLRVELVGEPLLAVDAEAVGPVCVPAGGVALSTCAPPDIRLTGIVRPTTRMFAMP